MCVDARLHKIGRVVQASANGGEAEGERARVTL